MPHGLHMGTIAGNIHHFSLTRRRLRNRTRARARTQPSEDNEDVEKNPRSPGPSLGYEYDFRDDYDEGQNNTYKETAGTVVMTTIVVLLGPCPFSHDLSPQGANLESVLKAKELFVRIRIRIPANHLVAQNYLGSVLHTTGYYRHVTTAVLDTLKYEKYITYSKNEK